MISGGMPIEPTNLIIARHTEYLSHRYTRMLLPDQPRVPFIYQNPLSALPLCFRCTLSRETCISTVEKGASHP